ncbi:MAG: sigma-70 factor domain-containing protein, partial [Dehalococcoidia bacterium]|nr:sigma-70 factor domain-containing protein [Dehalococcoidia bacterium]
MAKMKQNVKTMEKVGVDWGLAHLEGNRTSSESAYVKADIEDVVFPDDRKSTDYAEDSISLYIAECSKTPLLTSRDEKILSSRMELANYLS